MSELKRFKLAKTVVLEFKEIQSYDKALYSTFSSKAEIITNCQSDIDYVFESIHSTVKSNIDKFPGQGSSCIINSVIEHNINISYSHLPGSNYIKLPKELHHSRKSLINIQNGDDDKWFKGCLVRYLECVADDQTKDREVDELFGDK